VNRLYRYYVEILNHDDDRAVFYMYAKNVQSIKETIECKKYYTIDQTD